MAQKWLKNDQKYQKIPFLTKKHQKLPKMTISFDLFFDRRI